MEIEIDWSELAESQLKGIFDYYKSKVSLRSAKKTVDKIIDRVSILYKNPLAGQKEELLIDWPDDFRYLVESNYKIIYWKNDNLITIASVFDCRQNPTKMNEELLEAK